MIEKISKLNNEFNKSFPEVYLKPSKVNKFLRKYSNEVERKLKNFLILILIKIFIIYANGGFGRKEIFQFQTLTYQLLKKINQIILKILKNLFLIYGIKDIKLVILLDRFRILKNIKKDIREFTSYLTRHAQSFRQMKWTIKLTMLYPNFGPKIISTTQNL